MQTNETWIGIGFKLGKDKSCWTIECPCKVQVVYPVNGLPEVDTLHPCGNPNHYTVRYFEGV